YFAPSYGATNVLLPKIAIGEAADVAILTDAAVEGLVDHGTLASGSRRDLARSSIGIAVKQGAPKPDISTPEAFKHALLLARSIAFSRSGASGIHFANLIRQLGIATQAPGRPRICEGVVARRGAGGEVEIAARRGSELKLVPGIDIVGALPEPLQKVTVFSAGVFVASARPAAAGLFVE